jgi:hypothetical protein
LHNLIITVEGAESAAEFSEIHRRPEEEEDRGERVAALGENAEDAGEHKRIQLMAELIAAKGM